MAIDPFSPEEEEILTPLFQRWMAQMQATVEEGDQHRVFRNQNGKLIGGRGHRIKETRGNQHRLTTTAMAEGDLVSRDLAERWWQEDIRSAVRNAKTDFNLRFEGQWQHLPLRAKQILTDFAFDQGAVTEPGIRHRDDIYPNFKFFLASGDIDSAITESQRYGTHGIRGRRDLVRAPEREKNQATKLWLEAIRDEDLAVQTQGLRAMDALL